jgi:hypothetical protein
VTAAVPSDQTAADGEAFRKALLAAPRASSTALVRDSTLEVMGASSYWSSMTYCSSGAAGDGGEVVRFVEKPGPEEADRYVQAGYFWNAGIFVFRPSRLLAEARRVAGDLVRGSRATGRRRRAAGARRRSGPMPRFPRSRSLRRHGEGLQVRAVPCGRAGATSGRGVPYATVGPFRRSRQPDPLRYAGSRPRRAPYRDRRLGRRTAGAAFRARVRAPGRGREAARRAAVAAYGPDRPKTVSSGAISPSEVLRTEGHPRILSPAG